MGLSVGSQAADVLAKAPTGSGKTIAFGIPLVERTPIGWKVPSSLVLVPTRELALQVADEIEKFAAAIMSVNAPAQPVACFEVVGTRATHLVSRQLEIERRPLHYRKRLARCEAELGIQA